MSEYQKLKKKLFLLNANQQSNETLSRWDALLLISQHLNNPHFDFKSIHIAGTNGKGSVATKIAKALSFSGYKTALFTSPHISSYRERITIDGKLISKKDFKTLLKKIFSLQKKLKIYLSFFDITTILAFLYFSKKKVDFAIIETGIGGRIDATNIITPILSIITSISLDHTQLLGNTLNLIAFEKAGIIKPKIPVVIGKKAKLKPIIEKAKISKSELFISESKKSSFYDDENTSIASKALEVLTSTLQYSLSKIAIKKALKMRPPARFEVFKALGPKAIIFDAAHNEDGFRKLKKAIEIFFPNDKIRVILGFSRQKNTLACLKVLKTFSHFIHVIDAKTFKSLSNKEIEKDLRKINFFKYRLETDVKRAVLIARKLATKNKEVLLICGSFYIFDEIKKCLLSKTLNRRF